MSRAWQFYPGHMGGRVSSAQPVRKVAGRVASMGAGAVPDPPTVTYLGGISGAMTTASATSLAMDETYRETGAAAWVVASVPDVTISAPTGWTVAASGTSGSISWVAAHTTVTVSTDYTLTASGAGYDTSTLSGGIVYHLSHATLSAAGRIDVWSSTAQDAGSVVPVYAPSSATGRRSYVIALDAVGWVDDPYQSAQITRPSTTWGYSGMSSGPGYRMHRVYSRGSIPTYPSSDPFVSSEPGETDWVAIGLGFVA